MTYGTFCLVVRPPSSAELTSPSSPWNGGRSGSRSKRSTSSIPRWLVAITTGRPAARACSRRRTFISRPSHSSTITSAPATKSAIVVSSTPRGDGDDADVGIELGDLARGEHDLVHADVGDAAGDPVEVREIEHVEVGEPQLAADALVRDRRHHRAADREAGHGDAQPRQPPLLVRRDRVAVAVEAQLAVQRLGQDVHQPAAPRIEDPRPEGRRLAAVQHALHRGAQPAPASSLARRAALDELLELLAQLVDDDDASGPPPARRARPRCPGPAHRGAPAGRW